MLRGQGIGDDSANDLPSNLAGHAMTSKRFSIDRGTPRQRLAMDRERVRAEDCRVPSPPRGRVFNWIIVASAVAGVVVVVVPARHQWGLWLAGKPVDTLPLFWDIPVLIWGRIGKVLQFAAGLVAIIDLLDHHKLRATGRQAGRRLRERRAQQQLKLRSHRLLALRRKLYDSFIDVQPVGGLFGDPVLFLNTRPPTDFGPVASFAPKDYLGFRERVLAGLDVRTGGGLSKKEAEQIREQVDVFLKDHLPPEDIALSEQSERKWGGLTTLVCVALLGSVVYHWMAGPMLELMLLHGVLIAGFLTLLSPAGPYVAALPGLAREVPALLAGYLATHLLDRTHPLHAFRKIAVVLFIIGFGLDLLAS
ncbi:hypothetical protein [Nonomuraea sp. B19D2]|uniref:hypothetical protein n=1 Tax=Nonomuraea sp. B19D2 TaxID=3159561 RepID=UPI0032DA1265